MTSLRGRLLVAGPLLVDPSFHRTVVLLGEHGPEGAMGVVLNRPTEIRVVDAAEPLAPLTDAEDVVFVGGPVQPHAIVVLADFVDVEQAGVVAFDTVGFLPAEVEAMEGLGALRACRVFAGYAGWGPDQLEQELAEDAWIVADPLVDDVFTGDPEGLWRRVLRRRGGSDAVLALLPADPRVN